MFVNALFGFALVASSSEDFDLTESNQSFVLETKRIDLSGFPDAYNPSLIEQGDHFLLTFRFCPDLRNQPWISYIGVVLLDQNFQALSEPEILKTRSKRSEIPSQAEDARIFSYRGRKFLIYNDNIEVVNPNYYERRDLFLAEIFFDEGRWSLSSPLKLYCPEKWHQLWQKNWVPFEWNNTLMLAYSTFPHEVIYPNLKSGECYSCHLTQPDFKWDHGTIRGGTPAILVDGEYLAFFHSSKRMVSEVSLGYNLWHYFMAAYTFSAEPPFTITKVSPQPILHKGFYTHSFTEKRVVFPGGFIVKGSKIYLAYGKDDCEIWIAVLDLKGVKESLAPVGIK